MQNKKATVFSLDLRIQQEIIKLKVYEDDIITDIVKRLFDSTSLKSISKDKLKTKLEEQFRKIVHKKDLSQIIKDKLQSLLDQSKIVIMAIETDKNEMSMNETPFKILQESVLNGRKASQQKSKRNFHYLDEVNTNLNIKYQTQQNIQNQRLYVTNGDSNFDNVILRSKNISPNKYTSDNIRRIDKFQEFGAKFENENRKWQNLALKNINRIQSYYRHSSTNNQPQPFSYQTNRINKFLQQKLDHKPSMHKNDYRPIQTFQTHFQRSNSAKITQYLNQPCNNQNFHQYKMNRYKINNINFITQQLNNQPSYRAVSNREYIKPSKSSTKLNYTKQDIPNTANTIRNYDNTNVCATIRNYDPLLNTKSLSGAVSHKNLKGKFNYFGNE